MKKYIMMFLMLGSMSLVGCGHKNATPVSGGGSDNTRGEDVEEEAEGIVRWRASIPIDMAGNFHTDASGQVPVEIENPANIQFVLSTAQFTIPAISNQVLDFGKLIVSDLFDNNVFLCGTSGAEKCTSAFLRIYTTGTAGAGLYNAAHGYGMPITANLAGGRPKTIGLEAANAAVMQKIAVGRRNVIRLSDFGDVAPTYEIRSDFTNAGAGRYSTTLVVEYGLMN